MPNKQNLKKILKVSLYLALIMLFGKSIFDYNKNIDSLFEIRHVDIVGNNYVNTQEILNSISIKEIKSIFNCDIKSIKNNIEQIPFIKTVHIGIKIPDKLEIMIVERTPIALVIYGDKKTFIDYDNISLPVNSNSVNNFPVPILNIENIKIHHDSISIIKYLYKNYNSLYNNISEIIISNSKITIITDYRTKIFINPDMVIKNIAKLRSFEKSISLIKKINDYRYINLIYENQVVVKEKVHS